MLQRYNVDELKMEKVPSQNNSQNIYFEAYYYSLELCDNPEIAQKVALRFLESMRVKEQSASVSDCGKPRAVAFAAETEVGEAPDEKVISYAGQLDELLKIHLCHIQEARLTC